ncbi:AAA family ATPase [Streptomyces sp. NBC_01381]|uniref:AAA family ATPase n=1 Tax=Streptomyces sp. NBC_01381 TaxID=2903845 RepID=UPI0022550A86|nr:AAA family ATPase [Streptomyces sp. NBC_01381]MCX4673528.1 AAA family ATPase [Streptomyces sp. NBC_01381]
MSDHDAPLAAPWLARMFLELRRGRHLVLHGNIDDEVRWEHAYVPLREALDRFLRLAGFEIVGHFALGDGLTYADKEAESRARELLGPPDPAVPDPAASEPYGSGSPQPGSGAPPSGDGRRARLAESAENLRRSLRSAGTAEVRSARDLMATAHLLLSQDRVPCALVVHAADLLLGTDAPQTEELQAALSRLNMLLGATATVRDGVAEPLHQTLILVARDAEKLPPWLHHGNPRTASVTAQPPGMAERVALLGEILPEFAGGVGLSPQDRTQIAGELAEQTEGMSVLDMRSLAVTSRVTGSSVRSVRGLIARHRFGIQEDPWESLDIEKVAEAEQILSGRVIGQPAAVRAVCDVLRNARSGLDFVADLQRGAARPKGVFFFVGPTGVGKTELAKAVAELVFGDEGALRRFDMSEFAQEHASERLTGSPPGYVGHENGGVLTNWMFERPFSVLLFDEIEKAHGKVLDKFLQIMDDGRLTDGMGRTAYFSHTILVFTSNVGTETLPSLLRGFSQQEPGYDLICKHFTEAVDRFMTQELGRPELLGRFGGGIVAFDILRAEVSAQIVRKFLDQLGRAAAARGYRIVFDYEAIETAVVGDLAAAGTALGARRIRNPLLEQWIRTPLNRWVVENRPQPGARIWIHRTPTGSAEPFVVEAVPSSVA